MQKEPTAITHFKMMLSLKQTVQGSNSEHKYHIYRTKMLAWEIGRQGGAEARMMSHRPQIEFCPLKIRPQNKLCI